MAGKSPLHRTAVATATRYLSWTPMAPIRAWSRIRKAAEQRRDGLPTARRSILPIALRKITERTARFSQPDCERSDGNDIEHLRSEIAGVDGNAARVAGA